MIECPKDKIILYRASVVGYGVISGLQKSQKSQKMLDDCGTIGAHIMTPYLIFGD